MNKTIKKIAFLFFCISVFGCKSINSKTYKKTELKFLSEYILPDKIIIDDFPTKEKALEDMLYYMIYKPIKFIWDLIPL